MAGLANLYTRDFFRLVKNRLTDHGLFAQWIQSYELDWDTARGNLRFARQSANAAFAGVDFLAHLYITEDIKTFFGNGPIHTDNRPLLEFSAPRHLFAGTLDIVRSFCARELVPSYSLFDCPEPKRVCGEIQAARIRDRIYKMGGRPQDYYNLGLALVAAGRHEEAFQALVRALRLDPAHEAAHLAKGKSGKPWPIFQKPCVSIRMMPNPTTAWPWPWSPTDNMKRPPATLTERFKSLPTMKMCAITWNRSGGV